MTPQKLAVTEPPKESPSTSRKNGEHTPLAQAPEVVQGCPSRRRQRPAVHLWVLAGQEIGHEPQWALVLDRSKHAPLQADWPVGQQMLLEQLALAHWSLVWQDAPVPSRVTHDPPLQNVPAPQLLAGGLVQAPAPLQVDAGMNMEVLVHEAGVHTVPVPGKLQAVGEEPLQAPMQGGPDPAHGGWPVRGAPVIVVQVPAVPALQDWQDPAHATLQQTPSTQLPVTHSALPPQATPFDFLQTPAEHV